MIAQLHTTLYDSIRGREDHFQEIVRKAVESALLDLGDDVCKLDWANMSVSVPARESKAA